MSPRRFYSIYPDAFSRWRKIKLNKTNMFLSNDINEHVKKGLDEKVLIAKAISEWLM